MKKIEFTVDGNENSFETKNIASEYKNYFEQDKSAYEDTLALFNKFENVYRGTSATTSNVNSKSDKRPDDTNVIRNFTSEFIEAKVNTSTPKCVVYAKKPGLENLAKVLQEKNNSDLACMNIEEIADQHERNTYTLGFALLYVLWEDSAEAREYVGDVVVKSYHPLQFIPQTGLYDIDEMDRLHFVGSMSKKEVERKYNVVLGKSSEDYPELNKITPDGKNQTDEYSMNNDNVSVVVHLFKDSDGDICKLIRVDDQVLEYEPKMYYPRVSKCSKCGYDNPYKTEKCEKCGSAKLKTDIQTEITLEAMELEPITYKKKVTVVSQRDVDGTPIATQETEKEIIKERIFEEGEKVKIPAPKMYPIAIRKNVPLNFKLRGRSDVELLASLQESHKKVLSRIELKILTSTHIIAVPEGGKTPTNSVISVWKLNAKQLGNITSYNTQPNFQQDLMYLDKIYDMAQQTIGMTPTFQGQHDASARSGTAKSIQVSQTENILQSPLVSKLAMYSRLFKIFFYFDLIFTNEKRPYRITDGKGNNDYKEFNRFDFLMRDNAGVPYFETDFVIKAEMGKEIPRDKTYIYQQMINAAQMGLVDPRQFWQIMKGIGFPMAEMLLQQFDENGGQSDMAVQALAYIQQLVQSGDGEMLAEFTSAPIEQQLQYIEQLQAEGGTA